MRVLVSEIRAHLASGLRALFFLRMPPPVATSGLRTVAVCIALAMAALASEEFLASGQGGAFDAQGLSAAIAGWALFAVLVQCLRSEKRPFDVASLIATGAAMVVVQTVIVACVQLLPELRFERIGVRGDWVTYAGFAGILLFLIWSLAAYWRIGRAATRGMPSRLGVALPVIALLPMLLLPNKSIFSDPATAFEIPTVWDAAKWWSASQEIAAPFPRPPRLDVEAAWERQPAMVAKAVAGLAPSRPGVPEVYVVGAATYSGQDVFKREVSTARDLMDEHLGGRGRSLLLINHRDTLETVPLANATNLGKVLAGVGRVMDPAKDVLVLFVTSHGSQGLISVDFPRFGFNDLTPQGLAEMLDRSGIKNRVVILSACHSGSFVSALEGRGTLVMTAAHADKTSFGCSNEREWTYFGDALFNHALRTTHALPEAFRLAKDTVAKWETAQKLMPSEPQISMGIDIAVALKAVEQRLDAEKSAFRRAGAPIDADLAAAN